VVKEACKLNPDPRRTRADDEVGILARAIDWPVGEVGQGRPEHFEVTSFFALVH
jgi:hypothetical protein